MAKNIQRFQKYYLWRPDSCTLRTIKTVISFWRSRGTSLVSQLNFNGKIFLRTVDSQVHTPCEFTFLRAIKIEATKVFHLLPPFTHVLFGPIPRSYQTGSWWKGLLLCIMWVWFVTIFFWRLSVSLSKSISIPNSRDRRWREELWEIYYFNPNVLMRFFCTMSFVVDSRPSFVSATTSCTVQVRNMFVYAKLIPSFYF
jgi:hypothetical protein